MLSRRDFQQTSPLQHHIDEELRQRAELLLRGKKWGQKDTASLVNEVYLKLFGKNVSH